MPEAFFPFHTGSLYSLFTPKASFPFSYRKPLSLFMPEASFPFHAGSLLAPSMPDRSALCTHALRRHASAERFPKPPIFLPLTLSRPFFIPDKYRPARNNTDSPAACRPPPPAPRSPGRAGRKPFWQKSGYCSAFPRSPAQGSPQTSR